MFIQPREMIGKLEEDFAKPVESIMRCEDFKSNFARRLSNRYISRTPAAVKQENVHKSLPSIDLAENAPDRIEPSSQLSKSITEEIGEAAKPPDKETVLRNTEVSALNMEVETLRWQLSQTEANRQMHIALLKQIVSFLSRVKEHIEGQKPDLGTMKETITARIVPKSFNSADLPRSRSVVHVNKNTEYSLSPPKKINSRKISKSISNVNGYRDNYGAWSPSKTSLTSETESTQKISEEMSRLITLATTVLSTKIPDLASTCTGTDQPIETNDPLETNDTLETNETQQHRSSTSSLNLIEEDTIKVNGSNLDQEITYKANEANDVSIKDFILTQTPLTTNLENDFNDLTIETEIAKTGTPIKTHRLEKRNEYNVANFIEDESGFSSMSSFQEIGIPIISIIPPSPCKEVGYIDEITDILDDGKWKNDGLDLDKQTVKVFWV